MIEKWSKIDEFPTYKVSNYGEVVNQDTNRTLKESFTRSGLVKIGMVSGGIQHTRGVAMLVADAFVFGRTDTFNTPIHLDANPKNNIAENLLWRPRWFAWKYARQFVETDENSTRGPIVDLATDIWYNTMMDAAVTHGILIQDIWLSIVTKKPTIPTRQIFSFR